MVVNQFTQRPLPPELAKDDARRARRAPPPHTAVLHWSNYEPNNERRPYSKSS